jgi:hypothetical protein
MAHESFESDQIAELLNAHFVSIKVDREERPDLDRIYMAAVQALTGGGGWPLSVFVTADGMPFFGGTYWPLTPRYGLPSFTQVLDTVVKAWQDRRQDLSSASIRLVAALERQMEGQGRGASRPLDRNTLVQAFEGLRAAFDWQNGGWGQAPKFPQPMALEYLLRFHSATGSAEALTMVTRTLEAMARGGMYDQLGGGFHRYSVDARWTVPHFEKMLYDNAQLARVYLHAWQATSEDLFRAIAEETLDYIARDLTDPDGGFYSTQDADSEGEEGRFYVWTLDEVRALLGPGADAFASAHGITEQGNFEHRTILTYVTELPSRAHFEHERRQLWRAREARAHPSRDDKVLTSWNGLAMAAFAEAARSLERFDYYRLAERCATFLLRGLRHIDGRLLHTWHTGSPKQNGFLEDYACLIDGLVELYQTTFAAHWLVTAQDLAEAALTRFGSPDGLLYDTSTDHETLFIRPRELQDNATPSGNAMAVTALLKLAALSEVPRYVDHCHSALASMQPQMARYPLASGQWLQGLGFALGEQRQIAIVGSCDSADTQALLKIARRGYRPFNVVALGEPSPDEERVPLLQDRGLVGGRAAAYVCTRQICHAPVTETEALRELLG